MRSKSASILIGFLLAAALSRPAGAQLSSGFQAPIGEPQPAAQSGDSGWGFELGGNAGAATIINPDTGKAEIFNTLALQPEVSFGKLGLGLDLYIYFDSDGNVRKEDWDTGQDILSKIWYARWGRKGDTVHARVGGLMGTTIGHGFIMGGYSNRSRYPDERRVGAVLDIDAGWAGVESMAGDLRQASLLGGRFFVRPMRSSAIPLMSGFAVGVSGVVDRDPDGDKNTHNDRVAVYGADVELPVLTLDAFNAKLYADAAMMELGERYKLGGAKDNGKGYAAGLGGKVFFFDYRAEFRSIDSNFVPNFFDAYYEVDRSTAGVLKADGIGARSHPRLRGPFAQLYADILGKLRVGGSYEDLNVDPLGIYPRVRGEVRVDPSLFLGKLRVGSVYERRNVNTMRDLGRTTDSNAIITTEVGYLPSPNLTLVVVWKQTYDQNGNPVRTTQFRTDIRF